MGNRFVTPEAVRLHISDGDFIDIKKRLNHGEQEDLWARMSPYIVPGEAQQFQRREVRTAKVLAYLLGWSLTDRADMPVPMSPELPDHARLDTLRNLDPATFTEIYKAIDAHETAMETELAAQKKTRAGGSGSSVTLPSPVAVTGDMSGLPN